MARLCGYLPLAIRIAAARLRSRPAGPCSTWPAGYGKGQRALAELTTGDRSVAAAFTPVLPTPHSRAATPVPIAGLHPGPNIDVYAATSLVGAGVAETERLLEDLVNVHLLQQPTLGRYSFHDLLRQHAQHTARDNRSRTRPAGRPDAIGPPLPAHRVRPPTGSWNRTAIRSRSSTPPPAATSTPRTTE